jgi:hypothetical protein
MGAHEYTKNDDTVGGTSFPGRTYAWCKRNWLVLTLVLLGLAGLALALLNYLEPCVEEAVISFNATPVTNITVVENNYVRLVPMDMHVALDHSGSMGETKFNNAKLGITTLWDTINTETVKIANRPDAAPGSAPKLRFAYSSWTNRPSKLIFSLTNLTSAVDGVQNSQEGTDGGTAIGTGLARCALELVPDETQAPTTAPTAAPTLKQNADGVTVIADTRAIETTQACLVVTDGVAYDNAIEYVEGKDDAALKKECQDRADEYNAVYPGSEHSQDVKNRLRNTCDATVRANAMGDVIKACKRLGLNGPTECTPKLLAGAMRAKDIVIVGMYVGTELIDVQFGQTFLKNITSCFEPKYANIVNETSCPFFISSSEDAILPAAMTLANALIDSFASQTVSQNTTITNTTTILKEQTTYICTGTFLCLC